jgi:hypothetical protein
MSSLLLCSFSLAIIFQCCLPSMLWLTIFSGLRFCDAAWSRVCCLETEVSSRVQGWWLQRRRTHAAFSLGADARSKLSPLDTGQLSCFRRQYLRNKLIEVTQSLYKRLSSAPLSHSVSHGGRPCSSRSEHQLSSQLPSLSNLSYS